MEKLKNSSFLSMIEKRIKIIHNFPFENHISKVINIL